MKKYNLGSPRRPNKSEKIKLKTNFKGLKKYNIGPPTKVVGTPNTPRSKIWKSKREEVGYKHYEIEDYEPDEQDLELMKQRKKLGVPSPISYTRFEETITPFMTEALKKKPLTDSDEQVNEEAWEKKSDDTPNKRYPEPERLIPGKRIRTRRTRRRTRRTRRRTRRSGNRRT
jgi:hypothetical protein